MFVAPCPVDEQERLAALQRYGILDTAAEADFDAITTLLSVICETPIALISLVDRDRQWFKSRVGLDAAETPRDLAFCAHAILKDDILMVPDTRLDARFADNPLVLDDPRIRFYAGAPLLTPDRRAIGTLCAIDTKPRTLSPSQMLALQTLSQHVVDLLELRLKLTETRQLNQALSESQQALEKANAERNRFFANINHEMRTPLSAIIGFSRRLQKRIQQDAVPGYVSEGLAIISDAGQRLADLVDDVLDLSKLNAGKMELKRQPFNPAMLLQNVVNTVSINAEQHGVTLALHIGDDTPPSLQGDAKKLGQVVLNLLSNAIKFTPPGKKVTASCDYRDDALTITVCDEGVGIPQQDLERIFLPFEQSANAVQRDIKGTGLGLAIVRNFVDLMQGSIDVSSVVDQGTTFTVSLPLRVC